MREAPYRIIMSKEAAADLEVIFDYIAQHAPETASAFVGAILREIEGLADFPMRAVVESQPPGKGRVRRLPIGKYNVYFRAMEDARVVRIVRIVHGARRQPRSFN